MNMTTKKLIGMALLMISGGIVLAQSLTISQQYYRRVWLERNPDSLIKATPTGQILSSENNWNGYAITASNALAKIKGRNQLIFVLEPSTNAFRDIPPLPPFSLRGNFVTTVKINGTNRSGLWISGKAFRIP